MLSGLLAGIGTAAGNIAVKLIVSALSEKVMGNLFFALAEKYVESTETTLDNNWLADTKKSYYGNK